MQKIILCLKKHGKPYSSCALLLVNKMHVETKELKWIDKRLNLFTVVSINSFMFHRKSANLIKTLRRYSIVFCTTGYVA